MHKITSDTSTNRLYITMSGIVSLADAQQAKNEIGAAVEQLTVGFNVINDISKFIRGDDAAGTILKEIMILLIQKGVKNIIRVVGTSKMGLIQFANNSMQIEQYKISYVPTMEEAENLLKSAI